MDNTKLYYTEIKLVVLSDRPVVDILLIDIAREITEGDFSGERTDIVSRELSKREMALALVAQKSDPDFLLGDDGWKYALASGDEVTVLGEGGVELFTAAIVSIEYLAGDIVSIRFRNDTWEGS